MDKAMEFSPENIRESIQEAFQQIMNDPRFKSIKTQLASLVVASQTLAGNA